jgi:gliding motility-associated-like protein
MTMLFRLPLCAQESYCTNMGFELGNFTNWKGHTWNYSTEHPEVNTSKVEGFVNRRHTIMTDVNAYDANTGYALKVIPTGYKYSARLGDVIIRATDPSPRCWQQSLRYTLTIDSSNALLIMKFALVLQYIPSHTEIAEPRFKLTLYDQSGNIIPDCSNYDVYASNTSVNGFQLYQPAGSSIMIQWRDWTTVGANLMNYYGQTITIEFMSADCTETYHFGYAYFLAECHPLCITEKYCANDSIISLAGPEGFEKYTWTNSIGTVISNIQNMEEARPSEGEEYTCTMKSATGCTVSLKSRVARYIPKAGFTSYMLDCKSNSVQLSNLSTSTRGSLQYRWDFGDGVTSILKNPRHTFATSGLHPVKLVVLNPPSVCTDTLYKEVESFSPPLVGIAGESTFCPGKSIWLKAYGAYEYIWSDSTKNDSLKVSSPGGSLWLIGRSSTGCISDTIRKSVTEDSDWNLLTEGDTLFCEGSNTILKAFGAYIYHWNTGERDDSIVVSIPGHYKVVAANRRGCEKSHNFNVIESLLPDVNFSLSTNLINHKENQIICTAADQPDIQYIWDMGDATIGTGPVYQHSYSVTNDLLHYTIFLKAINNDQCTDTAYQIIDVTPFIPNVFSPNGDGINDVFMSGIDTEIFDRNGFVLYRGKMGWDGTYKGQLMDPDTYFYLIRYYDRSDELQTLKGYVTLVK